MFKILNQPLAICLAAYQVHYISLSDIYDKLINNNQLKGQSDGMIMQIT